MIQKFMVIALSSMAIFGTAIRADETRLRSPTFQAVEAQGRPPAGGKLETCQPGITTPQATSAEVNGGRASQNPKPIRLEARGEALLDGSGADKIGLITAAGEPIYPLDNIRETKPGTPAVSAGTKLAEKVAAAGKAATTIILDDLNTLTAHLTIPANIVLIQAKPGKITIPEGLRLTINGPFECGPWQCFNDLNSDYDGVVFGEGAVKEAYVEWWGGKADNATDNLAALTCAVTSHLRVNLLAGTYKVSDRLSARAVDSRTISGVGPTSVLHFYNDTVGFWVGNYWTIRDFTLQGYSATYSARACWAWQSLYNNADPGADVRRDMTLGLTKWTGAALTAQNMTVKNWSLGGFALGPDSRVENSTIQDCAHEGILILGNENRLVDNKIKNTTSWGIDINGSDNKIIGNQIYNCGDFVRLEATNPGSGGDGGGIVLAGHTLAAGTKGNYFAGNVVDTSGGIGFNIIAPAGSDYGLEDTVIDGMVIKNTMTNYVNPNGGALTWSDNTRSGSRLRGLKINNITIETTGDGHGISGIGGVDVTIDNYAIKNPHDVGIWLYKGTDKFDNVKIGKGSITGFKSAGIYAAFGTRLTISGGYTISEPMQASAYQGIIVVQVAPYTIGQGFISGERGQ